MILNASHEITNCGLPLHVQERYVRYKQGNRAIVAWMTSYGPEKYKGCKTLPIKQMIALGRTLCNKLQDIGRLPPDVDYYFKDVIKERAYLSQHFRHYRDQSETDYVETINHEHFTESLKQIHQILLTAGQPNQPMSINKVNRQAHSRSSSHPPYLAQLSRFSAIRSDDITQLEESAEDSLCDSDTDATSNCSHSSYELASNTSARNDQSDDFLDASGSFAQGVETIVFLGKLETISKLVRTRWTDTGKLGTNVTASTAYTDILIQQATHHIRDFVECEPDSVSFRTIQQRVELWSGKDNHAHQHGACQHTLLKLSQMLTDIERSLLAHMPNSRSRQYETHTTAAQSLVYRLTVDLSSISSSAVGPNLTFEWLQSMKHNGGALANTTELFTACFTLYIISESHFAYSDALRIPGLIAVPRISALKLANEALSSLRQFTDNKAIFPCQCTNTLSYRVFQMQIELERFVKFKCWTALIQSPLVAGNHTLEILDLCSYYGMHLFHYRHYVGSVIHTYNALVVLGTLKKIPVVDELVKMLTPLLFTTGKRPDSGFMASWLRYIGARLKFKTGKKHQNHKDTWCMSIPAHTAARSAGLNIHGRNDAVQIQPKFDYGTIDSTIKLKRAGWVLDSEQQQQLDVLLDMNYKTNTSETTPYVHGHSGAELIRSKNVRKSTHKRTKSCLKVHNSSGDRDSFDTDTCSNLYHAILSSFSHSGPSDSTAIPPSRLNLLSLFYTMTKVIAGISDATHATPGPSPTSSSNVSNNGKGQMCLCFTQTILRAADRILDTRKRSGIDAAGATWSKNEKECIECFKQHLLKVLEDDGITSKGGAGGAVGGKWLWESVV